IGKYECSPDKVMIITFVERALSSSSMTDVSKIQSCCHEEAGYRIIFRTMHAFNEGLKHVVIHATDTFGRLSSYTNRLIQSKWLLSMDSIWTWKEFSIHIGTFNIPEKLSSASEHVSDHDISQIERFVVMLHSRTSSYDNANAARKHMCSYGNR
ncbi:hypothetical protein MAR_004070, partial [Mya arenaria]